MQARVGEDHEIYQLETSSPETPTRLTDNTTHDVDVAMSQDGTVMVWQGELDDGRQAITIRSQQSDGSYDTAQLSSQYGYSQPYLSPNAEWLIMLQHRPKVTNVVRYQLSSGTYTVVATLNNGRQQLDSPSISNDGNQTLWLETGSEQKLVLTDLATDERDVLLRKDTNGNVIEHPSLMGDGQSILYSVNGQDKRQTFVQVISTGQTTRLGNALKGDSRYLSNQLQASLTFERFDLNLAATNGVLSVSPASDEGYLPGTALTAIGEDGFRLNEWLGVEACQQKTTCHITMPAQDLVLWLRLKSSVSMCVIVAQTLIRHITIMVGFTTKLTPHMFTDLLPSKWMVQSQLGGIVIIVGMRLRIGGILASTPIRGHLLPLRRMAQSQSLGG